MQTYNGYNQIDSSPCTLWFSSLIIRTCAWQFELLLFDPSPFLWSLSTTLRNRLHCAHLCVFLIYFHLQYLSAFTQLIKLLTASTIHGITTSLAIIIAVPKTCIIILGFHYRWGRCLAWRVGGWQLIGLVDRARVKAWFIPLHKSMRMKVLTSSGWLIYFWLIS